MASREVRKLVYARLWHWGDYQRHGYLPGMGDGIPSGNRPASRLPVPAWFLDLSRAFAALNPATSGLADAGRTAWLAHAPFNDLQRVVWAYYVDGVDAPLDLRRADKQQWAHDRDREVARAQKARDWRMDDEIAARLHLSGRTARRLRADAVWTMATLVHWDDEALDLAS